MTPEPPQLARMLVSLAARRGNRRAVVHDLREEFDSMLADGKSPGTARRWYWRQAITSLVPLMSARRPVTFSGMFFGSEGGVASDVRVGWRMLYQRPGFSAIVVVTLALGIGATSAVFSLIQGVLMTPPPYEDPHELALVTPEFVAGQEGRPPSWTAEQWLDWREESQVFESIAAYLWSFNFFVSEDGSESLQGMMVTHNYFQTTRLEPVIGRVFAEDEIGFGDGPSAIIIGHDLWMRRFGGDPGVLGQPLRLSRVATPPLIVGVMPPGVRFLPYERAAQEPNYDVDAQVDFWIPVEVTRASPSQIQTQGVWSVVGRLKDDVTTSAAEFEMGVMAGQQAEANPRYQGLGVRVQPLIDVMNRDGRRILFPLLAAAALVLLIACGNAATLLLVRGLQRQTEYSVRSALGAGRATLMRLVTVESMSLGLVGGMLGVLIAGGLVRGFKLVGGQAIPRLDSVHAGWTVLLFGIVLALMATVGAGLYPALRASGDNATGAMRISSTRTTASRRERRFLAGVSMVQAALTLTLLVGAGLLIRTMNNLARVESGYDVENVLTMSVTAVAGGQTDFHVQALEHVSAIAGVENAAFAWGVPLTGNNWGAEIQIQGRVPPAGSDGRISLPSRSVTPDYFTLLGLSIVEGRGFRDSDNREAPPVAIVNQTFVARYLDGANAVGRTFSSTSAPPDAAPIQIVGVVADSRTDDLTLGTEPEVYLSFWQSGAFSKHLVVKTAGNPQSVALAVQQGLRAVAPTVSVENVRTLDRIRSDSLASQSFAMQLLVGFAAVACILTLGGIYGLLSLSVASRRREIAIRTAVGAGRRSVLALVLRQGVMVIGVGIVVGLTAALGLSRVLRSFLFAVEPTDPLTLTVMGLLFAVVALMACWVPAVRAAAVDPVTALRED